MTLLQHLELFAIDVTGALLIAATAYAILRLPWTEKETDETWLLMVFRWRQFSFLPAKPLEPTPVPPVTSRSARRWIPIKVVQSC